MTKQEFSQFLTRSEKQSPSVNWGEEKLQWLENLEEFYDSVCGFVEEFTEKGTVKVRVGSYELNEEGFGHYTTRQLFIEFGNYEVVLRPFGAQIIGAWGRVDMIGPYGKVRFVLVPVSADKPVIPSRRLAHAVQESMRSMPGSDEQLCWKIATSTIGSIFEPMTQETFFDALREVVNGD